MAVLTSLPYETLVEILSLLPCPDLASTARVSTRFHLLSQPLLYTVPYLKMSPEIPKTRATGSSLVIFLRTLLTPGREGLASHVRSLRFEWDGITLDPIVEYWSGTTTPLIKPDEESWSYPITPTKSHLTGGDPLQPQGRQLMLLLDLLPRLEVLHFSPPSYRPSFSRFLESAAVEETLPCGLKSVREIFCPATDDCNGVRCRTLLVFLQLPQIRRIDVTTINRFRSPECQMENAASSSTVTHLRFSCAGLPDWLLSTVLLVPLALTHFSYTIIPSSGFQLSEFLASLVPLRPSLQYLHLDFSAMGSRTSGDLRLVSDEGSLREWPVLRTLSCSLIPLLGGGRRDGSLRLVNMLPLGIVELEILPDGFWSVEEQVEQVVEMLAEKRWVVPCLERLAVLVEEGMTQGVLDSLVVACQAAGVSFVQDSFRW